MQNEKIDVLKIDVLKIDVLKIDVLKEKGRSLVKGLLAGWRRSGSALCLCDGESADHCRMSTSMAVNALPTSVFAVSALSLSET